MTDPVDELFVGSLADFVARRDALVKQLKQDGDKDTAAAVKALRKPSTAAWSVNQVAQRRPKDVDQLIADAAAVHDAQADAVRGKGTGDLRTATEKWRTLIRSLAADVAKDVGEQYRDDAAATFEAASTSDEWSEVLRAGRLVATLSPTGFGLQGMPDPVLTPRHRGDARHDDTAAEPELVAEEDPRDEKAIAAARDRIEKATHKLRRAEQRLDQARDAVREAQAAREEAVDALRELER